MTRTLDQDQIKVSGSSNAYEVEVARIVTGMILSSITGKAIAKKIKSHGEVLITDDYPGIDSREINSDFQPSRSSKKLGVIGFHPHNKRINTSQVIFNGNPLTAGQLQFIHKHSPGSKPDEVLCHELLHAARYLGGDFNAAPIPSMPDYDNEEDFFAILVTNIYSSEKGRRIESFRKSHHTRYKPEMNSREVDPFAFATADDNWRLIAKFCKQHPVIAPMIAGAPAAFNPIRDFYILANSS